MVDADGVLHEDMGFYTEPSLQQFLADYATGEGIFMRHLGDVARVLGTEWRNEHCDNFIHRNATAVWSRRDPETNQISFNWNPGGGGEPPILDGKGKDLCDLILQASGLDALNLAARYLPDSDLAQPSPTRAARPGAPPAGRSPAASGVTGSLGHYGRP